MTPIEYIRIDADILQRQDLSDKAKMLLGLIKSFNSSGLMMSNSDLANVICCSEDYIGKLLGELKAYITVKNPQSRYRKIFYSVQTDGVHSAQTDGVSNSTPSFSTATPSFSTATPSKSTDITKKNTTELKNIFEKARKLFPGSKRGLQTEYDNFLKKHKDGSEVIHLLEPAIQREIIHKTNLKNSGQFCPAWKNFQTWINNRCWEQEFPDQSLMAAPWDDPDEETADKLLKGAI